MSWANKAIQDLKDGKLATVRPHGNSMRPKINSGDLVTISPLDNYKKGDIVLAKVGSCYYIHLIKAVKGGTYCIANNKEHINGWVGKNCIYGKVIKVER